MKRVPDQPRVNVAVLHDSLMPGFNMAEFHELSRSVENRLANIERGSSIHLHHTWVRNSQYDLATIRTMDSDSEIQWLSRTLLYLCFASTGARIQDYRSIASERLATLDPAFRRTLLNATLRFAIESEEGGINTIVNIHKGRNIFLSKEEKTAYLEKKRNYWKQRIEKTLGVSIEDSGT